MHSHQKPAERIAAKKAEIKALLRDIGGMTIPDIGKASQGDGYEFRSGSLFGQDWAEDVEELMKNDSALLKAGKN